MKVFDVKQTADEADVIINGYAFIKKEEGRTAIVNLNREGHAALLLQSGEVCETSMDDIELAIALEYFNKAKKFLEDDYAEVL